MGMPPALVRALGGRAWSFLAWSVAALGGTAVFGVLADGGWDLAQALLGALLAAAMLGLGGLLVHQRVHARAHHDDRTA